jgi:hypothetical protein
MAACVARNDRVAMAREDVANESFRTTTVINAAKSGTGMHFGAEVDLRSGKAHMTASGTYVSFLLMST